MQNKPGATGKFPHGKLGRSDEGELRVAVARDEQYGLVRVEFGKPVAWLAMKPEHAIEFAKAIMRKAGAKQIEVTL